VITENASIAAIVATVISLLLEWFPRVRTWWEKFTSPQKQGMMAGVVALISLAVVGVNCARGLSCPADWWAVLANIFLTFLAAAAVQQGVHQLTKRRGAAAGA
jgi:hypothetical protein